MGREDFSQSSQLTTLVGRPTNRYVRLPKNVNTLRGLTDANKLKPNNRLHYSIYPSIAKEYEATYTQLTNLDFYSPIITILGNDPVSHLINTNYEDAGITVDVGSELVSTVSTVDTNTFGVYKVTYTATDGINPNTTAVRTVKVGIPPDVTINGINPFNLEKFDVYVDSGVTINDSNSTLISTTSTVNNLAVGTYTVNYTVSNPAFTEVFSRTVRVDDTVPPVITITGGTPYELERFDPYVDEGATVDVGSELTNTDLSNVQNTAIGSFDVVYTAYDGNTTVSNIRTVNVVDTVPPVITITNNTLQGNTLERFESYVDEGATVDLGSELTNTDLSNEQNTAVGTFDVVYTAYDGNTTVTATRTVTVVDTKLPELTLIGDTSPYNLQPGIVFANVDPGFSNDAGTVVTVDYSNATIIQNTSFDVVYRGNDGVHPDIVLIRRVSVADTLSPIVTINGDQVVTIERYSEYVDAGVTLDPGSSLVNGYPISTVDNTATGTYTVTYLATDTINPDTTNVRTVHVVDTTPPIVLLNGADPLTMERFAVFSDIDPGVTYQSPHTGTLTSVDISQLDNTAIGVGTVTYNVVDDQNLSNTISRAVTVVDTTPPVATLNNASTNYTLERYGDWSVIDPGVTVDAGSFVKEINIDNTVVGLNRPVDYVISDGNTLHDITVTRNITIEDTVPPYAELIGSNSIRVPLNSVWEDVDLGLTNFDTGSSLSSVTGFDNTVTSVQTVSYNLTDGVNSNIIYRDVTFTLPSGTVNTAVSSTLERFDAYVEPHEAIINITDGYLARIDTSNVDNTATHGTQQVIVYDLGDNINNTLVTRTITIEDTVPPFAELIGSNNIRVPLNSVWEDVDPGLTNFDAGSSLSSVTGFNNTETNAQFVYYNLTDGVNSNSILRVVTCTLPSGTVNTAASSTLEKFGTYVEPHEAIIVADGYLAGIDLSNVDNTLAHGSTFDVVYDLGDGTNNTHIIRTVTVVDTTAPVITLDDGDIGTTDYTVQRGTTYVDPGATADTGETVSDNRSSNLNMAVSGTYIVTYSATDVGGNTGTADRIVIVEDTIAPVITLDDGDIGTTDYTVQRGTTYVDPGATADTGETVSDNRSSNLNMAVSGTYIVTYSATDVDGNTGTADRIVIVEDTTAPVITLADGDDGTPNYTVEKGTTYVDPGATADTGETVSDNRSSNLNMAVSGTYIVTYSATDVDGNTGTADRIVIVEDTTAPVITLADGDDGTPNYTVEKGTTYVDPGATADTGETVSDNRSSNLNMAVTGTYTVTYSATDVDGNTGTADRIVIVEDTTGPVITLSGDNPYEVVGRTTYVDPGATADGGETVTSDTTGVNMDAPDNYTVTYSATDAYGNNGTASRMVTVLFGWNQQQKIQASDKQWGDEFGWSVAISDDGNTAIVGARREDTNVGGAVGATNTGAAYIFTRSGTSWTQQQKIQPSDLQVSDYFGTSVAISDDGNSVIVGAPGEDTGGSAAGAAYIFTWSETSSSWSEQQKIQASDKQGGDQFGWSVAISGDGNTAIAGGPYEDLGPAIYQADAGAAYIFTWSETSSNWSEQQKIQGGASYYYFGYSVAISEDGNTIIVGAYGDYSAYIFTRSGTSWTQQQRIQSSDIQTSDYFGVSVAISDDGNTAIVGAHYEDNTGSAYIFTRSGTTWSEEQKIQASDKQGGDQFGWSVTISGDGNTAIVGALGEDAVVGTNTLFNAGAAYIFTRSGTTWTQQKKIQASDKQGDDEFGRSVAISGDGNTAIAGAAKEDTGGTDAGAAYIYKYIT
jgi:hypothetical protein